MPRADWVQRDSESGCDCYGASDGIRIPWLYNYNASGAIQVPNLEMFGVYVSGPQAGSSKKVEARQTRPRTCPLWSPR